jgi:hypothetical protein
MRKHRGFDALLLTQWVGGNATGCRPCRLRLEENPVLMQLRMLQSIEAGTGNTIVFGWPANAVPIPTRRQGPAASEESRAQKGQGEAQPG